MVNECEKASLIIEFIRGLVLFVYYPPATEASKEVANLKERKNSHTHVQEFVTLSVCLSQTFEPNYLRTGRTVWAEICWGTSLPKNK